MATAFIVRPFGTKSGIDFDAVDRDLIQPVLQRLDILGRTTGKILEAGNIREDMFQELLVADIVIADVSIHNANVFYELGIRHALQPRRTFLIRARSLKPREQRGLEDDVPFDLKTDRYLEYDSTNPAGTISIFIEGLRQTLASERQDSPVFLLLPDLRPPDRSKFLPVPLRFREDVDLAAANGRTGILGLLSIEAREFPWGSEALRLVGRAQFRWKDFSGAKKTWESFLRLYPLDVEANLMLGTVYQRLKNLTGSDQALQRVIDNRDATPAIRAEALALVGRNIKDRWRAAWIDSPAEQRPVRALRSPHLLQAYARYAEGFDEDLNSFYPGLNALGLLTIALELAAQYPDVWGERFSNDVEADRELKTLESHRQALLGAISMALRATRARNDRFRTQDRWLDISHADFQLLTSNRPGRVAFAYQSALSGAEDFYSESVRGQLMIFQQMGVRKDNVAEALDVLSPPTQESPPAAPPQRVVLFTGHMIDPPGRATPRFPPEAEPAARSAIRSHLENERGRTSGQVIGMASGSSGGDILFHEVCQGLGIPTRLLLPIGHDRFRSESVSPAGRKWEERFDAILRSQARAPVLLSDKDELPIWLGVRQNYNTWQRANVWFLQEALAVGAPALTLLALWDGTGGDGPGGTEHMIRLARDNGAAVIVISTETLLDQAAEAPTVP